MVWWSVQRRSLPFPPHPPLPSSSTQLATLVNVKLKWVKDRTLDSIVTKDKHLRPAHHLLEQISSDPRIHVPLHDLSLRRHHFHFHNNTTLLHFLRRFPSLFLQSPHPLPSFHLSEHALSLRKQELHILTCFETDIIDRLRRLLMLTLTRSLPIHTINQLRWDMGLPYNYHLKLLPRYPHYFQLFHPPDDERLWVKLLSWDNTLAISELQKSNKIDGDECNAFPVRFTRGFGLNRKCAAWLQEWQRLPYTSPYEDASGLDPRTDVAEKRMVGVFHELLHLTLGKKTERRNVSNLRKPFGLPQKFTKVFERHPGVFYLSQKLATQTVVLREGYGGGREILKKHPLLGIRERYRDMMWGDSDSSDSGGSDESEHSSSESTSIDVE